MSYHISAQNSYAYALLCTHHFTPSSIASIKQSLSTGLMLLKTLQKKEKMTQLLGSQSCGKGLNQ